MTRLRLVTAAKAGVIVSGQAVLGAVGAAGSVLGIGLWGGYTVLKAATVPYHVVQAFLHPTRWRRPSAMVP